MQLSLLSMFANILAFDILQPRGYFARPANCEDKYRKFSPRFLYQQIRGGVFKQIWVTNFERRSAQYRTQLSHFAMGRV